MKSKDRIVIASDGTARGTTVWIDGVKQEYLVSFRFSAHAGKPLVEVMAEIADRPSETVIRQELNPMKLQTASPLS